MVQFFEIFVLGKSKAMRRNFFFNGGEQGGKNGRTSNARSSYRFGFGSTYHVFLAVLQLAECSLERGVVASQRYEYGMYGPAVQQ